MFEAIQLAKLERRIENIENFLHGNVFQLAEDRYGYGGEISFYKEIPTWEELEEKEKEKNG